MKWDEYIREIVDNKMLETLRVTLRVTDVIMSHRGTMRHVERRRCDGLLQCCWEKSPVNAPTDHQTALLLLLLLSCPACYALSLAGSWPIRCRKAMISVGSAWISSLWGRNGFPKFSLTRCRLSFMSHRSDLSIIDISSVMTKRTVRMDVQSARTL